MHLFIFPHTVDAFIHLSAYFDVCVHLFAADFALSLYDTVADVPAGSLHDSLCETVVEVRIMCVLAQCACVCSREF